MLTIRTAQQCGCADYGWLQSRYTFSFGHYFDPNLLGYASLRVLNQETLAPNTSLQPRTYPKVDILNIILEGEAEYRSSEGQTMNVKAGDIFLFSAKPDVCYSEYNLNEQQHLVRMQLWLNACAERENPATQKLSISNKDFQLIASPDSDESSLQLRQDVWIYHINLAAGEERNIKITGDRAYLQLINGSVKMITELDNGALVCGDGAFIEDEKEVKLIAEKPSRMLLIDLHA